MRSLLARPPEQLLRLAGTLADSFYLLAFVALLAALSGAPGLGLLFLGVAGAVHAARIGIEETVRGEAEPSAGEPEIGLDSADPEIKVYAADGAARASRVAERARARRAAVANRR